MPAKPSGLATIVRPAITTLAAIFCLFPPLIGYGQFSGSIAGENVVFPSVLYTDGPAPGVIDVTKPPFNADPTGVKDSTKALIQAYETVYQTVKQRQPTQGLASDEYQKRLKDSWTANFVIYLPNGTYRVSDTIVYSSPMETPNFAESFMRSVRFCGQSREKTVIKLIDHAPGFDDPNHTKAVVRFGKTPDAGNNNTVGSNFFENMTIDVGSGNAGAVGLMFETANSGAVRDLTIRSPDGKGAYGLFLALNSTQGLYQNLLIEGFDIGINTIGKRAVSQTFEYITLRGQRVAGIRANGGSQSIRKVLSENQVPALVIDDDMNLAVVVDCAFTGGGAEQAAVKITDGHAFIRNVTVSGYKAGVVHGDRAVVVGSVGEYLSHDAFGPFRDSSDRHSRPLPVKETPRIPWESDLAQWIGVHETGAVGDFDTDDTAAIQAAMNSGKAVVYFKPGKYNITAPITIPPSVTRVQFMYAAIYATGELKQKAEPLFLSVGESDTPLLLEDIFTWNTIGGTGVGNHCHFFGQGSGRSLVLRDMFFMNGIAYRNHSSGNDLHLENVAALKSEVDAPFVFSGKQHVWARWLNPEHVPAGLVRNEDSTLWVLGFKTEAAHLKSLISLRAGSRTEILGGAFCIGAGLTSRPGNTNTPAVEITNAQASISALVSGIILTHPKYTPDMIFRRVVSEQHGLETKHTERDEMPLRGETLEAMIPLYVSGQQ